MNLFKKILKIVVVTAGIIISIPVLIGLAVALIYFTFGAESYFDGANLRVSNSSTPSKYIFVYDQARSVVINDEFSQIIRSWGGSPDKIEMDNGVRTITFAEPAILKTRVDSIEPREDEVKVKGYMGVITEDTEFIVDSEGIIWSTNWYGAPTSTETTPK